MKKKIITGMIAMIMVATLTACGGDKTTDTEDVNETIEDNIAEVNYNLFDTKEEMDEKMGYETDTPEEQITNVIERVVQERDGVTVAELTGNYGDDFCTYIEAKADGFYDISEFGYDESKAQTVTVNGQEVKIQIFEWETTGEEEVLKVVDGVALWYKDGVMHALIQYENATVESMTEKLQEII